MSTAIMCCRGQHVWGVKCLTENLKSCIKPVDVKVRCFIPGVKTGSGFKLKAVDWRAGRSKRPFAVSLS